MWLAHTGVTTGWSAAGGREYRPLDNIERGAMAAFMFRLAGSPEFTPPATSPFRDVPTTHQFYKEITWMRSVGITTGYPDGTFRPDDAISREAMAAFMYRAAGTPAYSGTGGFSDTGSSGFQKEIAWVKSQGISTGYPDGTFKPNDPVKRDAMAAFMYRLTQKGPLLAKAWPGA